MHQLKADAVRLEPPQKRCIIDPLEVATPHRPHCHRSLETCGLLKLMRHRRPERQDEVTGFVREVSAEDKAAAELVDAVELGRALHLDSLRLRDVDEHII